MAMTFERMHRTVNSFALSARDCKGCLGTTYKGCPGTELLIYEPECWGLPFSSALHNDAVFQICAPTNCYRGFYLALFSKSNVGYFPEAVPPPAGA
jgi:hypothetical protein